MVRGRAVYAAIDVGDGLGGIASHPRLSVGSKGRCGRAGRGGVWPHYYLQYVQFRLLTSMPARTSYYYYYYYYHYYYYYDYYYSTSRSASSLPRAAATCTQGRVTELGLG